MARITGTKNKETEEFNEIKKYVVLKGIDANNDLKLLKEKDPDKYLRFVNRLINLTK